MKIRITDPGGMDVDALLHEEWVSLTVDMVPSFLLMLLDSPFISHVFLDDVDVEQHEHYLQGLWGLVNAKHARVGVVEPDPEQANLIDQRASSLGLDLSAALTRSGRWSPVLSRRQRTEESLTATLERLGTKDVRRVALDDELLQREFPVTRRVAWERAYLGRIG